MSSSLGVSSCREINAQEHQLTNERQIAIESFAFTADTLAIIFYSSVSIYGLTVNDLDNTFYGTTLNGQALGGSDGVISLYGLQRNSGTFMYFRERFLGKDYAASIKQMNGNAQILDAVKADPNAIAYIGFEYLTDESGHKGRVLSPEQATLSIHQRRICQENFVVFHPVKKGPPTCRWDHSLQSGVPCGRPVSEKKQV